MTIRRVDAGKTFQSEVWPDLEVKWWKKRLRQNGGHDSFVQDLLGFDQQTSKNTFQWLNFQVATL